MIKTLQSAFNFSAEDLRANQYGELSGRQVARQRSAKGAALLPLLLAVGLIVVGGGALLLAAVFLIIGNGAGSQDGGRALLTIACVAVPALAVALLIGYRWLVRRYIRHGRVVAVRGRFRLYDSEGIVAGNSLLINKHTFPLTRAQSTALRPYRQQQIALYFVADSRNILSIDVLL